MREDLIHPRWDPWLVSGAGSLVLAAARLLLGVRIPAESAVLWSGIYLFSLPHFLASYVLFYSRPDLVRSHFVRAWIWPAFLAFALAVLLLVGSTGFELAVILTYGFLLWHFCRQAFGAAMWLGRGRRKPAGHEGRVTLLTVTAIALAAFLSLAGGTQRAVFFGFGVAPLPVPRSLILATETASTLGVVLCALYLARAHLQSRGAFSIRSVLPVVVLYVWLSPWFSNVGLVVLLPLFHALQYLPFCGGEFRSVSGRKQWSSRQRTCRFLVAWMVLWGAGLCLFVGVPHLLRLGHFQQPLWERAAVAALLFLNLHHFSLDAVLWKSRHRTAGSRAHAEPESLLAA